jgi:hypothetical protein
MGARAPVEIVSKAPSFIEAVKVVRQDRLLQYPDILDFLQRLEQRWKDDDRKKGGIVDAWQKICRLAQEHKGITPTAENTELFIRRLLIRSKVIADIASKVAKERASSRKEFRRTLAELHRLTEYKMRTASLAEKARISRFMADAYNKLDELQSSNKMLLGMRSDKRGSRALRVFVQHLSAGIYEATGQRCDGAVAIFAHVAFDGRDMDADGVRKLRSPTTRKGRMAHKIAETPNSQP